MTKKTFSAKVRSGGLFNQSLRITIDKAITQIVGIDPDTPLVQELYYDDNGSYAILTRKAECPACSHIPERGSEVCENCGHIFTPAFPPETPIQENKEEDKD